MSSDNPWKFWSNLEVSTQQLGYPANVEGNHPNTEKAAKSHTHIPSICERFSFIYKDPFLLENNPNVEWSKGSRYLWQVGGSGGDIHSFVGFGTTEFPKLIPKKKVNKKFTEELSPSNGVERHSPLDQFLMITKTQKDLPCRNHCQLNGKTSKTGRSKQKPSKASGLKSGDSWMYPGPQRTPTGNPCFGPFLVGIYGL